jgi:peptide/nickel transport system permease protein
MSDVADAEGIALKREHPARATLRRLFRHRLFVTGLFLFGIIAGVAIAAPWITGVDPQRLSMRNKFLSPSETWIFGTDNFGRSLWSRVVWGAQLSMIIGASVVALNAVFGTLIGALAGYFRRLDNALMRVNDALMAFPAILLAIAVTSVLGPSTLNVILALSIVYIPRTARIVRSSVIVLREMEYVQAAIAAGAGHWRILRHHILPNAMAPMIVQLSFLFAYAVPRARPWAGAPPRPRRPGGTSWPRAVTSCARHPGSSPSPAWR